MTRSAFAFLVLFAVAASAQTPPAASPNADASWRFVVAGDSRNCGDVIMPAIAVAAKANNAQFYWHLGDLRAIYEYDEDMVQGAILDGKPLNVSTYLKTVWPDAIQQQFKPFAPIPVYVGIGNHETIYPKTREQFIKAFSAYLDQPAIRDQRLRDDPSDKTVHAYYHVVSRGIDFITLDNGSCDMFDEPQVIWLEKLLKHDGSDPTIRTVVVGMHAALPNSLACGHSMSNYPRQLESGTRVYHDLLDVRDKSHKLVYVVASHSHFVMGNVYDSDYWQKNGGVLPGWIVGTSGAIRYRLPDTATPGAKTDVYGYLLATVDPPGSAPGTIAFEFKEITPADIPAEVNKRYSSNFVTTFCFACNRSISTQQGTCPQVEECKTGEQ
jgi:hypothetical protein